MKKQVTAVALALCAGLVLGAGEARAQYARFSQSTDTISIPTVPSVSTTMTIEARVYLTGPQTNAMVFDSYRVSQMDRSLAVSADAGQQVSAFGFAYPINNASGALRGDAPSMTNRWVHIAYCVGGGTERVFIDGVQRASRAGSGTIGFSTTTDKVHAIGAILRSSGINSSFVGYIDTFRISSTARYTANFTPPTGDLATDSSTVLLYNFNEPVGSATVHDCTVNTTGTGLGQNTTVNDGTLGTGFAGATSPVFVDCASTPSIGTQPVGTARKVGNSVTFSVTATGQIVSYQWRKNGVNIAGATAASLTLNNLASADAALYDVVVSDAVCGRSVTSTGALLSVSDCIAPSITAQPVAATRLTTQTATVSVTAAATGTLSYQWKRNGVAVPGATGTSLIVLSAQAGNYSCVVTDTQCGLWTESLAVPVVFANCAAAPVPGTPPPALTPASLGQPVSLTAQASGLGMIYQWRRDGVDLPGATGATLNIAAVGPLDYGTYTCVVRNACGTFTTAGAVISSASVDAASAQFIRMTRAGIAAEVVRSAYMLNPNPRLAAVCAAIGVVAARNPLATDAQLSAFVTAYDAALAAAYAGDARLMQSFNLQTAVRYKAIVPVTGLDTNIGEEVLISLGLDPVGPSRQLAMAAFQYASYYRFGTSEDFARALRDGFNSIDYSGAYNGRVEVRLTAYVRSQGIEPYPTSGQLAQNYPEVAAAFAAMPQTPAALAAARASGFSGLRALAFGEMQTVQNFTNRRLHDLHNLRQVYATVTATAANAASSATVAAAQAQRTADVRAISASRSVFGLTSMFMADGTQTDRQAAAQVRRYGGVSLNFADTTSTLTTSLSGVGTILSSLGGLTGSEGPMGVIGSIGGIMSGISTLIPLIEGDQETGPQPLQQVSDQIYALQLQTENMRVELLDRFDRVDAALGQIYGAIQTGFTDLTAVLAGVSADLAAMQVNLATVQTNLSRFEQALYGVLQDGFNFTFVADMDFALGFRERTGNDLYYTNSPGFSTYESSFFTWATSNAASQVYAGPNTPTIFNDGNATVQLTNSTLGYNINSLSAFPQYLSPAQPVLSVTRVVNPTTWSVCADAYATLARENPWYFARTYTGDPTRVAGVKSAGQSANTALDHAKSTALFTRLGSDYTARVTNLQNAVNAAESQFLTSTNNIPLLNLWGPTDQTIAGFAGPALPATVPGRGTLWFAGPGPRNLNTPGYAAGQTQALWNSMPKQFLLARYLGLAGRSMSDYTFTFSCSPWSGQSMTMDLEFYRAGRLVHTRRLSLTAVSGLYVIDSYQYIQNNWDWDTMPGNPGGLKQTFFTSSVAQWTDPAELAAVTAECNEALRGLQSSFLSTVVGQFGSAGNIKTQADLLKSSEDLFDAFMSMGIPESLNVSEVLQSCVRGSELGIGGNAAIAFYAQAFASVAPGSAPLTARPNLAGELNRRYGLMQSELNVALNSAQNEQYPFMQWCLAGLQDVQDRALSLTVDDQYYCEGSTLMVGAAGGVLANDAKQPGATITAQLVSAPSPSAGVLTLSSDGGFTFTPAYGFAGTATFTYRARGEVSPGNFVTSSNATVQIIVGPCTPSITGTTAGLPFAAGAVVGFQVTATGPGLLSYQWRHNGVAMTDGANVSGSRTPTLVVYNTAAGDIGRYDCVVSNTCGTAVSNPITYGSSACSLADVCGIGGAPSVPDGLLTGDDFVAFIGAFAANDMLADVCGIGGPPAIPDGLVTGDDFIAFIAAFAAGCP